MVYIVCEYKLIIWNGPTLKKFDSEFYFSYITRHATLKIMNTALKADVIGEELN